MIHRKIRQLQWTLVLCIISMAASAQVNSVIIGDTGPAQNGAALEVRSTDKGFLIPRVNLLTDIASPAEGLMAYQLQEPRGLFFYDGANWRPWPKPVSGTALMTGGGTVIEHGEGFSITNIAPGRDEVFLDMQYPTPPIVQVSSGVISGLPPSFPSDYCGQVMGACNAIHLTFLALDYPIGGALEFNTGTTNCAAAPGNRSSYLLTDPGWAVTPPTLMTGQMVRVRFGTPASSHSVSVWADWNQNGTFEVVERVYSEPSGFVGGILNRNADFMIPPTACNGTTAFRVTVTDTYDHNVGCGLDSSFDGETEEIEVTIGGGVTCVYQERQTSCNVSGVLTDRFRVECSDLNGSPVNARYYFKVTDNQ
jgi:hypothetical protein